MRKIILSLAAALMLLITASCAFNTGVNGEQQDLTVQKENSLTARAVGYNDNVAPSQLPPGNLNAGVVPMFVTIGFDDNQRPDGMEWIVNFMETKFNPAGNGNPLTYDGTKAKVNFYFTGAYAYGASPAIWLDAYNKGHEVGNHTQTHAFSLPNTLTLSTWRTEIENCNSTLTSTANIPAGSIYGFRAPFLQPSNATMEALKLNSFVYDCSIEEGFQPTQDGTNFFWPYTLDGGAPGQDYLISQNRPKNPIGSHPGLWEMGVRALIIPPDNLCAQYGVPSGLRAKIAAQYTADPNGQFDMTTGKITGLDYSLWVAAKMTAAEALATLKYTFDLRMQGNRAPFLFGAHTDEYSTTYTAAPNATWQERRATIESFIDYVLSHPEVRMVGLKDVVDWMRTPEPIIGATPRHLVTTSVVAHTTTTPGETAPVWQAGTGYSGGSRVEHNGKIWEAKWWTDMEPGTTNAPWLLIGDAMVVIIEYYGNITPLEGSELVAAGESREYFFNAEQGCSVKDVTVNGVSQGAIGSYLIANVDKPYEIIVEFQQNTTP